VDLSDLLDAAGPAPLRAHHLAVDGTVSVGDVVIADVACPLARGQVVLAVGVEPASAAARSLLEEAEREGVAAVVFRAGASAPPPLVDAAAATSVLLADADIGWAQLLLLLRTLTSAAQDDTASGTPESATLAGMHGLADAIAVMVGGSVVLYDRAHRVIAYSVQGHEIDEVRRDAILGKRTPEQWITRFTVDRSAYQTYRRPDEVVRVDRYPNLRTRLRIAVHAGGEILGEVSVAEGRHPLGAEAEIALKRAARLAVPFMLRHRLAEDTDRTARWQLLRGLLEGDPGSAAQAARAGLDPRGGVTVVGFAVASGRRSDPSAEEVFGERLVHLLSLQMGSIDPAAGVVFTGGTYYAVVPARTAAVYERLPARLGPALTQLQRLDIEARAAIGRRACSPAEVPLARRDVDDLLVVLGRGAEAGTVGTRERLWAEIALLPAERAVAAADPVTGEHVARLAEHDARHGTEFVKTLWTYLEMFGSISAAAEELVLHPNTLRHRLQRLTEISGVDLEVPAQRLALALQLRVAAQGDLTDLGSPSGG
jgi:PucR-like helix-turn-helix protein